MSIPQAKKEKWKVVPGLTIPSLTSDYIVSCDGRGWKPRDRSDAGSGIACRMRQFYMGFTFKTDTFVQGEVNEAEGTG